MKGKSVFSVRDRLKSFGYAFAGLRSFAASEPHAKIHLAATVMVAAGVWFFRPSPLETMILVLCMAFVWFAELVNTCLEKLLDLLHPELHPVVKKIKDMAAAAVLVAALAALICGLILFLPPLLNLFK